MENEITVKGDAIEIIVEVSHQLYAEEKALCNVCLCNYLMYSSEQFF